MIRVKNEEEFLLPSVLSVAELVDEIIIIDNLSTDRTSVIINELKKQIGSKIKTFSYPYEVARMGEEYQALQKIDPNSPSLLHNYYNWCLSKCTMPFIMKWDGDMIASSNFSIYLKKFKRSSFLRFDFGGYNLSADKKNILTLDAIIEPRVYPKLFALFKYIGTDCEELKTWVVDEKALLIKDRLYLHMKYCKAIPCANFSQIYKDEFTKKLEIGCKLPEEAALSLQKWSTISGSKYEG